MKSSFKCKEEKELKKKNYLKRILGATLAGIMLFSMAGCGGSEGGKAKKNQDLSWLNTSGELPIVKEGTEKTLRIAIQMYNDSGAPEEKWFYNSVMIESYELMGVWGDSKVNADGRSNAIEGPLNSYDGGTVLSWKPVAQAEYCGNPGIIYTLDNAYNLESMALTFSQEYYFKLYTSQDGVTYNSCRS